VVSFAGAIVFGFQRYFDFSGRSSRSEYWWWILFVLVADVVLTYAGIVFGTYNDDTTMALVSGIFSLVTLIPGIAVGVRRLHDINKTGWWVLFAFLFFWLFFIPILLLLYWATRRGDQGDNKYGPQYQSIES
tara:strand:+ start:312 stop:707 length:396 start_codon:yes stop_codon:yes gene_type:complete